MLYTVPVEQRTRRIRRRRRRLVTCGSASFFQVPFEHYRRADYRPEIEVGMAIGMESPFVYPYIALCTVLLAKAERYPSFACPLSADWPTNEPSNEWPKRPDHTNEWDGGH